jgi:hypothetical protein
LNIKEFKEILSEFDEDTEIMIFDKFSGEFRQVLDNIQLYYVISDNTCVIGVYPDA